MWILAKLVFIGQQPFVSLYHGTPIFSYLWTPNILHLRTPNFLCLRTPNFLYPGTPNFLYLVAFFVFLFREAGHAGHGDMGEVVANVTEIRLVARKQQNNQQRRKAN